MSAARCRYVQGKCFGLGMRGISLCEAGSCPGPVGGEFPATETPGPIHETKPVAPPPAREEEETMASTTKPTPATCPECKRPGQALYACKYHHEEKVCTRCSAKFANRAKKGTTPKSVKPNPPQVTTANDAPAVPGKAKVATKAPCAPKEPRREAIAPPRPAPSPAAGLTLTFRLTLAPGLSVAALAEILRDLPAGAELVW